MIRRRKRLARLHLRDAQHSVEGIWAGMEAGHYRLLQPRHIETAERSFDLEGELFVPKDRVEYVQVIG